jgi:hypothetical protein
MEAGTLLLVRCSRSPDRSLRRSPQPTALPQEPEQPYTVWRLLRPRQSYPKKTRNDQEADNPTTPLATSKKAA